MSTNSRNNSLLPIIFLTFFKIGGFTFGGGFAMIPLIQKEIVSRYKWLSDEEFLDTIAVTQGAPGPVAVNTAVFIGYKLAGVLGSTVALLGTILPSFLIILIIAMFLQNIGQNLLVQKFFLGVRPAIIALILSAGLKLAKKSMRGLTDYFIGLIAILLLLTGGFHPIVLIILGALWGISRIYYVKQKGGHRE
ncbi:MAG: chromate transporter [Peptococcia bacterium]